MMCVKHWFGPKCTPFIFMAYTYPNLMEFYIMNENNIWKLFINFFIISRDINLLLLLLLY